MGFSEIYNGKPSGSDLGLPIVYFTLSHPLLVTHWLIGPDSPCDHGIYSYIAHGQYKFLWLPTSCIEITDRKNVNKIGVDACTCVCACAMVELFSDTNCYREGNSSKLIILW